MGSYWGEHFDENHQAIYYYNTLTRETTWEKPSDMYADSLVSDLPVSCSGDGDGEAACEPSRIKFKPKEAIRRETKKIVPTDIPPDDTTNGSLSDGNGGSQQDYVGLSKIYSVQRPYLDYSSDVKCVLCRINPKPRQVFYPCQHRCVCDSCIASQQVCTMEDVVKFPSGYCNCPLCGQIIKKILPAEDGKEEDKYWEWVLEVKPPLPDGFMKGFRHSAAIIQKVHIEENIRIAKQKARRENGGCFAVCVIS